MAVELAAGASRARARRQASAATGELRGSERGRTLLAWSTVPVVDGDVAVVARVVVLLRRRGGGGDGWGAGGRREPGAARARRQASAAAGELRGSERGRTLLAWSTVPDVVARVVVLLRRRGRRGRRGRRQMVGGGGRGGGAGRLGRERDAGCAIPHTGGRVASGQGGGKRAGRRARAQRRAQDGAGASAAVHGAANKRGAGGGTRPAPASARTSAGSPPCGALPVGAASGAGGVSEGQENRGRAGQRAERAGWRTGTAPGRTAGRSGRNRAVRTAARQLGATRGRSPRVAHRRRSRRPAPPRPPPPPAGARSRAQTNPVLRFCAN